MSADLTLRTHSARMSAITAIVRASEDHRAFVFHPDTVDNPKRVANWGWLRRIAQGYSEPALVHPAVGTTFYVRQWRFLPSDPGSGGYARIETFDPVFIARLSDGRTFADQWADPSVLFDALNRWRNASGYLVDWEMSSGLSIPTCAIGGLDWATIPDMIAERYRRRARERELSV